MRLKVLVLIMVHEGFIKPIENNIASNNDKVLSPMKYNELDDHSLVSDGVTFPFMAAILMKSKFLSAGALIDTRWVLTAADSVYLIREAKRTVRVRLGSINYKKGGITVPVKYIVMHPYFDDLTPGYDLAMMRLPEPVRETPTLKPIRLQMFEQEPDGSHFIVPSWPDPTLFMETSESEQIKSTELITRLRLLSVSHLHPLDFDDCVDELASIGVNETDILMCLDTRIMVNPCSRDFGAPVVLNGFLWGIVSSWLPDNCSSDSAASAFVSLISAPKITTWIDFTIRGIKWDGSYEEKESEGLNIVYENKN